MKMKFVNSFDAFLRKVAQRSKSSKSLWYRGQLEQFDLKPSLFRHTEITSFSEAIAKEWLLREDFKELAGYYFQGEVKQGLRGLMQMQHYRVPTRLLDWTRNPLVGLFFALTESQRTGFKEDSAVWMLEPSRWNSLALQNVSARPAPLGIDAPELTAYIPPDPNSIPPSGVNPVAVRGQFDSSRIVAQQGAFVLMGNSPVELESMNSAAIRLKIPDTVLTRVTIPSESAPEMLKDLLTMGITDDFVFPDLDGVVSHIRRKNGY